eukprot:gnl/TRDRNA2_/TRDRNA2_171563_c7_seq1.p1 gnl/TRDRNA2_/TRDRNA2_171563_c7~~gnl/TRDRNA2_/TRDRNA2_171563_c7_seq1.p1  ORF type:complete len:375 (+),score=69.68 gnl/TRDRNA2_/TRDRNA2_171563_c7_seq1:365-1489(+)
MPTTTMQMCFRKLIRSSRLSRTCSVPFFSFELFVRFMAFEVKANCMRDSWFVFDLVMLVIMVFETWLLAIIHAFIDISFFDASIIKVFRLIRLSKMGRLARLLRSMPELTIMLKGMSAAARSVFCTLCLLMMIMYIFGIVLRQLSVGTPLAESTFTSVGAGMYLLVTCGTFLDDVGDLLSTTGEQHWIFPVSVLIFILIGTFTVLNMLIGVLCEVVSAVAAAEKEDNAIRMVKDNLLHMLKMLDEDGSGLISQVEIQGVLEDQAALAVLESLHVDMRHLMEHLEMYFERQTELSIHEIMDLILILRGERPPTVKDLLHSMSFTRWKITREVMTGIDEKLEQSANRRTRGFIEDFGSFENDPAWRESQVSQEEIW